MKKLASIAVGWLMAFLLLGISPLWAQEEAGNYFTITGIVKNKDNKRKLENVNVSVPVRTSEPLRMRMVCSL